MKAMGCEVLIVSNACGGMNPQWAKGDIMLIEDHINLIGDNPLIGKNDDRLGVRFPDMCHPYDRELLALAQRIALEEKISCHKGVFVAVPGPNLETRAEYRFLRGIGADVVGMSTVPEVIVGVHARLRIWACRSSPICVCRMRWSRRTWRTSSPWPTRRRRSCACSSGGSLKKSDSPGNANLPIGILRANQEIGVPGSVKGRSAFPGPGR